MKKKTSSLLGRTAIRALLAAGPLSLAMAAPADAQAPQGADVIDEVVVTGSRIARIGAEAPTPVTVLNNERMEALALTSVAEAVLQLPQFRTSATPAFADAGTAPGQRLADLRGMKANRTLVLFEGRRFTPTTSLGTVDLNLLPSLVAARTEVVTGGASAAYGADAVAGVVNIIPDTRFDGLKAQVQLGTAEEGDAEQFQFGLAGGTSFGGGRGHVVASFEYEKNRAAGDCYSRDWCQSEYGNVGVTPAGTNGFAARNILPNVHNSSAAPGGLITNTALRGIKFLGGQQTGTYVFGTPASPTAMFGGSGAGEYFLYKDTQLAMPLERHVAFAAASFELTESVELFASGHYGHLDAQARVRQVDFGSLRINTDNAFLPTAVRAQAQAAGITSFLMGRLNEDINPQQFNETEMYQVTVGARGTVGGTWKWDAFYQYGHNRLAITNSNSRITANFNRAIDAVVDPARPGTIVCRSTLTAPTNGCVPLNLFGSNQFSQAAFDDTHGRGVVTTTVEEHIAAANLTGSPFKTWAGPVDVAIGLEHRQDEIRGGADALSAAFAFAQGNGQIYSGEVKVTEGYAEAVVPLARDMTLARKLDLNGAVRRTHYNTSGNATTWKVGVVYEPVEGLRFRATQSRDIRAPNASELFSGATQMTGQIRDTAGPGNPTGSNTQAPIIVTQNSNPNLTPEKADTWTVGVVVQPRSLVPGLTVSFDYYDISLENAIGRIGPGNIVDRCAAGATEFCPLLRRDANGALAGVTDTFLNFGGVQVRGFDIEASYNLPLERISDSLPGALDFNLFATHAIDLITSDSAGSVDRAGMLGLVQGVMSGPDWIVDATVSYRNGPLTVTLQGHHISSGIQDAIVIGPHQRGYSPTLPNSINDNTASGRTYFNLAARYKTEIVGRQVEFYGAVNNLFDKDPPVNVSAYAPTSPAYFDTLGRYYKAGIRIQF